MEYEKTSKKAFICAVLIILMMFALFLLSSCASTKVVSRSSDMVVHDTAATVTSIDSTSRMETHIDSVRYSDIQHDTLYEVRNITDSTIINRVTETVITNTVNTDGTVIGTDRVTTNTISRDHYRVTDNNTQRVSDRSQASAVLTADSVTTYKQHLYDSIMAIIDSTCHDTTTVKEVDKRSWWSRVVDTLARYFLGIALACVAIVAVYLSCKYYIGK